MQKSINLVDEFAGGDCGENEKKGLSRQQKNLSKRIIHLPITSAIPSAIPLKMSVITSA